MSLDHNHHDKEKSPHPSAGERDARYWNSLEQWGQDPEFQKLAEAEFNSSPLRENSNEEGWARREFLKLMGASLALSASGCIRRPVQKIVPYNKQPEEVVLGQASYYSSVYSDGLDTSGVLIRTREGRPLMVEGNKKFPTGYGVSSRGHAHILSLYDPDRSRSPLHNLQRYDKNDATKNRTNRDTITVKWEAADEAIVKQLKEGGVALLIPGVSSPTTNALIGDFAQAFGAKVYGYDDVSVDSVRAGQEASYGTRQIPNLRLDRAKMIISVDGDFLGTYHMTNQLSKQFADGRRDPKTMNRLVAFESTYSLTGANADIRVRIKPTQQLDVVMGLAHDLVVGKKISAFAGNGDVASVLRPFAGAAAKLGVEQALWDQMVSDLAKMDGETLVVAGGPQTETVDGISLQVAVNFLNSVLGNDGKTVEHGRALGVQSPNIGLADLIADINAGAVKTLIMHGSVNPVYSSPLAKDFVEALKKVKLVVSTADRNDETSQYADYVLPDNHVMEGWNDAQPVEGLFVLQQPTIRPMYDTRSFQLTLMSWAYLAEKGPKRLTEFETYYDYLRAYWRTEIAPKVGGGKAFDDFWDQTLQNGFAGTALEGSAGSARSFRTAALSQVKPSAAVEGYQLVLYPTSMFAGGTLTNVSWLHEQPDPVTKICWDNYVSVSLKVAEKEKLKEGDIVELKVGDKSIEVPVHIQPGQHDEALALAIGYGRTHTGQVGNKIGVSAVPLMVMNGKRVITAGQAVTLKKTGKNMKLASVQSHHTMEGRKIVVEATLKQYLKNEATGNAPGHVWSMWSGHQYNGHKWAMAVDLNTCNGCGSCQVACQSENNIPVVGKRYVIEGREMQWLRIDRYYVGTPENPEVVFQPVMCQQCDNAPCETVCPVLATVHSSEGLNDMVYNRCVGTRYCSNNCPYKVRRFNWFNYAKNIQKPLHLALNPDVTVRSRGVMEKCTFCVHRIKEAKLVAKLEKRDLRDGDATTACEASCAAGAIIFGDMNDPNSRVSKAMKQQRAYALLEEFGAAPSVRYLTKIRNNYQETRFQDGAHQGQKTEKHEDTHS
ncbi:MAG: TAT-variant-translocated molybdopterin oxidoreductase [Bdellovibrionaceae bacterium]|nr:TAT-variant-translocated molybdopterin oxidoreductase [Pseudobdellovibrionaceae bacterium]